MEREAYHRNFFPLLVDSIVLLESAELERNPDLSNTLARSSIINSMLIPEVVANICVETLDLERSIFQEIDKLSVLGKFDFFLRTTFRNRKIDRGISVVQGLQEIKKLRDGYVHPKKQKVIWVHSSEDEATAEREESLLLKIATNSNFWHTADAVAVMRGTHDFLYYFFHDCCRYSKKKVASLLFSEEVVPDEESLTIPYLHKATRDLLNEWNVNVSYVKLGWL
ncbi:hypothetical protein [Thauera sp. 27]|uniref:hypothetical protein n=1 Tax=Thauera sp. 27 TaxID=305700 RepID=UPI0012FA1F3E|nr:hypothetical protein [Thauera sp. 27]